MSDGALQLADHTCREYHEQAVVYYSKAIGNQHLPLKEYHFDRAQYPDLASVVDEVAARQVAARHADFASMAAHLLKAADHVSEHPTSGLAPAAANNGGAVSNASDSPRLSKRPRKDVSESLPAPKRRSRPFAAPTAAQARLTQALPAQAPTAHAPAVQVSVVQRLAAKPPCPYAPPGKRDTPTHKEAVSQWIKARCKGNLSKKEQEALLVNNFMRGKVFLYHPCNDLYDERTNLDPELWGDYTEWGKTLVPEATVYNGLSEQEKEQLFEWADRDMFKALYIVSVLVHLQRLTPDLVT